MTVDISPLEGIIWVYFCVAVPSSLIAFVLVDVDTARDLFDRIRGKNKKKPPPSR